jgi:hypothetical protein
MIQTVLAINGQDCTIACGNSPEEYEAIAITLLRTAEAIRNREEGQLECLGSDGNVLAYVRVHHCSPTCSDEALADVPTIERVGCADGSGESMRAISRAMIDEHRRASRW